MAVQNFGYKFQIPWPSLCFCFLLKYYCQRTDKELDLYDVESLEFVKIPFCGLVQNDFLKLLDQCRLEKNNFLLLFLFMKIRTQFQFSIWELNFFFSSRKFKCSLFPALFSSSVNAIGYTLDCLILFTINWISCWHCSSLYGCAHSDGFFSFFFYLIILLFIFKTSLLEYNCFTIVC